MHWQINIEGTLICNTTATTTATVTSVAVSTFPLPRTKTAAQAGCKWTSVVKLAVKQEIFYPVEREPKQWEMS